MGGNADWRPGWIRPKSQSRQEDRAKQDRAYAKKMAAAAQKILADEKKLIQRFKAEAKRQAELEKVQRKKERLQESEGHIAGGANTGRKFRYRQNLRERKRKEAVVASRSIEGILAAATARMREDSGVRRDKPPTVTPEIAKLRTEKIRAYNEKQQREAEARQWRYEK